MKRSRRKVSIRAAGFSAREQLVFDAMEMIRRIENSSHGVEGILESALAASGYGRMVIVHAVTTWREGSK